MRVAVVGSGISGMVAASRLHRAHEVTVFEAGSHVGGHTNTVDVHLSGRHYAIDTGFIVFNDWTYPRFIQRYVFPGSFIPSVQALSRSLAKATDLKIFHLEDIGPHYARTLRLWRERFVSHRAKIRELGC